VVHVLRVVIRVYVPLICIQHVERSSLSKEVRFCSASHTLPCIVLISISKRDPLSSDHKDKMCLYSASSAQMKMFLQSGPTWTTSKGFNKLTESPLPAEWIVSQIAACLNKMTAERTCGRSTDLIQKNVMGLSVLGVFVWLCVCVWIYTCLRVLVSLVCATIRLNPQLSLTGLAEWTAEVYHCLLISSDSHQPIRAGHSEWPQWESLLWAGVNVLWLTYLRSFKAGAHLSVSGKVK